MYAKQPRPDDPGEFRHCDNCHYPARLAHYPHWLTQHGHRDLWLCEICSQTHFAIATTHPDQCPDPRLYQSLAASANIILEAVRAIATTCRYQIIHPLPDEHMPEDCLHVRCTTHGIEAEISTDLWPLPDNHPLCLEARNAWPGEPFWINPEPPSNT